MIRLEIVGGVVINAVEVNANAVPSELQDWPEAPTGVGIGWTFDGTDFAAPVTTVEDQRAEAVLSRKDFARATAAAGHITYDEAADYANGVALPSAVEAWVATQTGADALRFDLLTEDTIKRLGAQIPAIAGIYSLTDTQIDALFGIA